MSAVRPLVRHFPRPTTSSSSMASPYLVSMIAGPQGSSSKRTFSTTEIRKAGSGSHYEPPSGWLFGVPPGEKYKKEGWENIWVWGFWGSLCVAVVAYAYKPDTSIQTWALEEARRRLEAEGILPEAGSTAQSS